jgi:hypothetical protein
MIELMPRRHSKMGNMKYVSDPGHHRDGRAGTLSFYAF